MKKIEITADWILNNFPHSHTATGDLGLIEVKYNDAKWIYLVFEQCGIDYEEAFYDEENDDIGIEFSVSDIEDICPKLYDSLFDCGVNNHKTQQENIQHSMNMISLIMDEYNNVDDITTLQGVDCIEDLCNKWIGIYLVNSDMEFYSEENFDIKQLYFLNMIIDTINDMINA